MQSRSPFVACAFMVVAAILGLSPGANAADDITRLKPGAKVIVDFGGEKMGEFVEYSGGGWLKVRLPIAAGRYHTMTVPPRRVRLPADDLGAKRRPTIRPPANNAPAVEPAPPAIVTGPPRENPTPAKIAENAPVNNSPAEKPAESKPAAVTAPKPPVNAAAKDAGLRTWLGASGKFKVDAEFVALTDGIVEFKKADGSIVTIPLDQLTAAGQASVKRLAILPDEKAILGSWKILSGERDGKLVQGDSLGKVVFSATEITLMLSRSFKDQYRLDSAQIPKQLDYCGDLTQTPVQAIYELKGDELRICMALRIGEPRPTGFSTKQGDRHELLVCKRVPALAMDPLVKADMPVKIDPEIVTAVNEKIALLEANELERFIERTFTPDEQLRVLPADRKNWIELVSKQRDKFLVSFRAALRVPSKLSADRTDVEFDLSAVHVEGGLPLAYLRMNKIQDTWCLVNKFGPQVKIDPEVVAALNEKIALLEARQIEKFVDQGYTPTDLARMTPLQRKQTVEHISNQRDKFLNTLRVLQKLSPKMNPDRTEATFDLAGMHIENGAAFASVRLVKIEGVWYLAQRQ
jgi:uncharacterized protein (TIGR03067 family)